METNEYIDQLRDIRKIMDKSTRFLSLSGLSGILAGVYALIGAVGVNMIIDRTKFPYLILGSREFQLICAIAAAVLLLSVLTAFILSRAKTAKTGEKLWSSASKRLFVNFSIPLVTGGAFGISLLQSGNYGLIAPVTLIFYGLALFQASKYTLESIRYLGISFIVLGLINCWFVGYSLYFWALGFGVFHIVYGSVMYFRLERNKE